MRCILSGLFLLLCPLFVVAQNYPFLQFGQAQGLPSNSVYDIYRDTDGFMWFATDKGVSQYDGSSFRNFTSADGLSDNEIFFFQPDHEGRVWLGTTNGTLCFYKDGTFHNATNTPYLKLNPKYQAKHTVYINLERDSSVTIYFTNKEFAVNIQGEQQHIVSFSKINAHHEKQHLVHIGKIAANRYELIYEYQTLYVDTFNNIINTETRDSAHLLRYHKFRDQEFFIVNQKVYDRNRELFPLPAQIAQVDAPLIYRMYRDKDFYFISTAMGFLMNGQQTFLPNERVSCIAKDIDSNYWISTLDKGLFVLPHNFRQRRTTSLPKPSSVTFSFVSEGAIFYSTAQKDLYRIAPNGTIKTVLDYYRYTAAQQRYDISEFSFYRDRFVFNCHAQRKHQLFCISHLNAAKPTIRLHLGNMPGNAKSIILGDNNLYLNCIDSLMSIANEKLLSGATEIPSKALVYEHRVKQGTASKFVRNRQGEIWFSNDLGLHKIVGDTVKQVLGFGNTTFKCFDFLAKGILGITENNLLVYYPHQSDTIGKKILPNNGSIWERIFVLDDTRLLVTSNNCYYRVQAEPGSRMISSSVIEDLLLPTTAESICSDQNFCHFFKSGNVYSVPIKELFLKSNPPLTRIKSLESAQRKYSVDHDLRLAYDSSRDIRITFDAISFCSKSVLTEYQLVKQGEPESWKPTSIREVNFYNLASGSYTFRIRAKTTSSAYTLSKVLSFTIEKPYWEQWWFLLICSSLLLLLISMTTYLRIQYVVKRKEAEHTRQIRTLKSEYRSLNALMNPHFVFNALNSVQRLINLNEKSAAAKFMKILANLIRQNMQNLQKELISLQKEIDLVNNYLLLEKLRFKEKLNFEIKVADDVDADEIQIPPLIIQPLVENAVVHGFSNEDLTHNNIQISVYRNNDTVFVEVWDNGAGIQAESSSAKHSDHESTGIQNVRQRLAHLEQIYGINVQLSVRSVPQTGTKAILSISDSL